MIATVILWSHALAALLFGLLATTQLRHINWGLNRLTLVVALGATSLWALAVAGFDTRDVITRVMELLRDLAWLGFMYALVRRNRSPRQGAVGVIYGVVVMVTVLALVLTLTQAVTANARLADLLIGAGVVLRMIVAVSALVLVHDLHSASAQAGRGGVALALVALALMWSSDLLLYGIAYFSGAWPTALLAARGICVAALAPLFAIAAHRDGEWALQLSRKVAFQSLSAIGLALCVGMMLMGTELIGLLAGEHARLVQTAFVVGATTALLTLASSPWLRAWTRVMMSKHLFRHRYDYRAEWLRFTDTLGLAGDAAASLDSRIVKAVADLVESPAGALLMPVGDGLDIAAAWTWERDALPPITGGEALARHLAATGRIIDLDSIEDRSSVPDAILAMEDAWVIVPLLHFGQLTGAILLARPVVERALDWEDLDLLRISGRQVASYLAENRAHGALAEAQRFDEFNRRFAFILHDIKNLVSQLTLVARNAERHADNPAFREDMVATLKESAERMNALLARLSQHHGARGEELVPVDVVPLVERLAAGQRNRHPVAVTGEGGPFALADAGQLEQILGHLIQNAVEASAAGAPVEIAVSEDQEGVCVEVIDTGCGMTAAFIRDELFRPFASTKPGGFGIGAFEARQLVQGMGGGIAVQSRPGEGTRFRITLRTARSLALEAAA